MMKGRFRRGGSEYVFKSKRFRNNWIIILLISSIPGLIFGGLMNWLAGGRLENELLQMHNKQIQLRAANIDEQFSYLETSVVHWAFDPNFSYSLASLSFSRDFEIARDITQTLAIMQGSNPLAKNAELVIRWPSTSSVSSSIRGINGCCADRQIQAIASA